MHSFSLPVSLIKRISISVLLTAIVTFGVIPSAFASDYPEDFVPGEWSSAPFSIQSFSYDDTITPGDPRCHNRTYVVISGDYAKSENTSTGTASFTVQMPSTPHDDYAGYVRSPYSQTRTGRTSETFTANFIERNILFGEGNYGILIEGNNVAKLPQDENCDRINLETTQMVEEWASNFRVWVSGDLEPIADFNWTLSDSATNEVSFLNLSENQDGTTGGLSYSWNFGDGTFSSETNPTHTFSGNGPFTVTLTVTNASGKSASISKEISIVGLVVNSTGDSEAADPEAGCATGAQIGQEEECTLRAAIQVAQERGGGEITFDIAGTNPPNISILSSLPEITTAVTIDATTQDGGQVALTGPSTSGTSVALHVTDGTLVTQGLVINNFNSAILIEGGFDHSVTNTLIGVNPQGTSVSSAPNVGVRISNANAIVSNNQIVANGGVLVYENADGVEITDNAIGVTKDRKSGLEGVQTAISTLSPNTIVSDNTISAETAGVLVVGADATDVKVTDNHIGVSSTSDVLGELNYGVRIDAAPGAKITGNKIVALIAGIGTAGTIQIEQDEQGETSLIHPDQFAEDGTITGGDTTIVGNVIGKNSNDSEQYDYAIVSWVNASNVSIAGNTIFGDVKDAISITGGNNHSVASNTIGDEDKDINVDNGISIENVTDITIGGSGTLGNTVNANSSGIRVTEESSNISVYGNTVRFATEGIYIGSSVSGTASVDSNVVKNNDKGIQINGDGVVVIKNVVSENEDGIIANGDDTLIENNRVGLDVTGNNVLGNTKVGIYIDGEAVVTKNIIAGSGEFGVKSTASAKATLTSNNIYLNEDGAISTASGPAKPNLIAAVRKTVDNSTRTTLIIDNLPAAGGGTLEVFADNSCDIETGAQARYVLDITRTTKVDETARVIQIIGNASRTAFTVTYTDLNGRTSVLSDCAEARSDYPDSDGDGVVDPIDQHLGMENDPSRAWVVTDNEQLLLLHARSFELDENSDLVFGEATLENVAIIDDPAPGAHPSGWQMPYGVLQFRINVPEAGGRALVTLTNFLESSPMPDAQYFKYGPETPGANPSWYNFSLDAKTITGATLITGNTSLGMRRSFALYFQDGARGDSDGGANRTITDPGAIVLNADPNWTSDNNQENQNAITGNDATVKGVDSGGLAVTGSDSIYTSFIAILMLIIGTVLMVVSSRKEALRP